MLSSASSGTQCTRLGANNAMQGTVASGAPLACADSCWRALGPSSIGVERRYTPAKATVIIGKIAFEVLIRLSSPLLLSNL
jgi:hypothetical protein